MARLPSLHQPLRRSSSRSGYAELTRPTPTRTDEFADFRATTRQVTKSMSSRGHNHPGYCTCRFCQPRNLTKESHLTSDLISVVGTRHSYTIPIACPICGDAVFLYQSEHGGRVFFDELGPPWPKHPCTDGARAVLSTASIATDQSLPTKLYSWQRAGWLPITEVKIDSAGSDYVRLNGKHNSQSLTLYIPVTTVAAGTDPVAQIANSPIHARWTVDGTFEVAFVTQDLRPARTKAFTELPGTP